MNQNNNSLLSFIITSFSFIFVYISVLIIILLYIFHIELALYLAYFYLILFTALILYICIYFLFLVNHFFPPQKSFSDFIDVLFMSTSGISELILYIIIFFIFLPVIYLIIKLSFKSNEYFLFIKCKNHKQEQIIKVIPIDRVIHLHQYQ